MEVDLDQDDYVIGMTFKTKILEFCGRGSKSNTVANPKLESHLAEV